MRNVRLSSVMSNSVVKIKGVEATGMASMPRPKIHACDAADQLQFKP